MPDLDTAKALLEENVRKLITPEQLGETLTVFTDEYLGTDDRGNPDWDEDTTGTETPGRVVPRTQREIEEIGGDERVTADVTIYVPSDVDVQDGTSGENMRASEIETERGTRFEVVYAHDEHNGLLACDARLMD